MFDDPSLVAAVIRDFIEMSLSNPESRG
jgi:hypothetical protein